jgi:hypothetical protein
MRNLVSHDKRERGLAIFKNRVMTKVRVSMWEEIRVDRSKTGNVRVSNNEAHSHNHCCRGRALTFSRLMTHIYIYICHTALLTSRPCILYIYSTDIRTEYFKHAALSPFFPLQNAFYFIMLPFLVPVLFTF